MQFQADLLQIPWSVLRDGNDGLARLIRRLAVVIGRVSNSIARQWKVEKVFEPKMPAFQVAALRSDGTMRWPGPHAGSSPRNRGQANKRSK